MTNTTYKNMESPCVTTVTENGFASQYMYTISFHHYFQEKELTNLSLWIIYLKKTEEWNSQSLMVTKKKKKFCSPNN